MNKVNIMSLAACGVLAQPTAMAETFIQSPAPAIYRSDADGLSHQKLAEFIEQLSFGKALVTRITENADNLYFSLIEMSADEARMALSACEDQAPAVYESAWFMRHGTV